MIQSGVKPPHSKKRAIAGRRLNGPIAQPAQTAARRIGVAPPPAGRYICPTRQSALGGSTAGHGRPPSPVTRRLSPRREDMAAPRTRPFIGINADLVTPAKAPALTRLPVGYVDAVTQAGGMP